MIASMKRLLYDSTIRHYSQRLINRIIKRFLLLSSWFVAMFFLGLILADILFQ